MAIPYKVLSYETPPDSNFYCFAHEVFKNEKESPQLRIILEKIDKKEKEDKLKISSFPLCHDDFFSNKILWTSEITAKNSKIDKLINDPVEAMMYNDEVIIRSNTQIQRA